MFGHRPARPVRRIFRFRVLGQLHDLSDFLVADRRLPTTPCGHLTESGQSVLGELRAPRQHRRTRHPGHLADLRIRHPSAADNSTQARCTTRCAATRDCAKLSKICRCPSDTANGVAIRLILHSITNRKVLQDTTLDRSNIPRPDADKLSSERVRVVAPHFPYFRDASQSTHAAHNPGSPLERHSGYFDALADCYVASLQPAAFALFRLAPPRERK